MIRLYPRHQRVSVQGNLNPARLTQVQELAVASVHWLDQQNANNGPFVVVGSAGIPDDMARQLSDHVAQWMNARGLA